MSQSYIYTDADRADISIGEHRVTVDETVACVQADLGRAHVHLPASERAKAAQALAGDAWRVVPADPVTVDPGPHTHEWDDADGYETCLTVGCDAVNPTTVKVGDIVSVEADDDTWAVRGECIENDPTYEPRGEPYRLVIAAPQFEEDGFCPDLRVATVRVVRPAPDPAEQEIQALHAALEAADTPALQDTTWETMARALHARGVRVVGERGRT